MGDGEDEDEVCHSVVGGLCAARDFPSQEILTVTKRGLAENSNDRDSDFDQHTL
jgi:hypothetical protein